LGFVQISGVENIEARVTIAPVQNRLFISSHVYKTVTSSPLLCSQKGIYNKGDCSSWSKNFILTDSDSITSAEAGVIRYYDTSEEEEDDDVHEEVGKVDNVVLKSTYAS
jgi:hypothetical protein